MGRIALFSITVDVVRTFSLESNSRIKYYVTYVIQYSIRTRV